MGLRRPPYVFTELGVAMLSSVLNSELAIKMNIVIMRAFVKLRQLLATNKELASKMEQLELTQKEQGVVLALLIGDVKSLDKKIMKKLKGLKASHRNKPKIGFRVENLTT